MQRPFVFLATSDSEFESIATNAILETNHGVRPAHDLDQAYHALSEGGKSIGLAIIDVTHGQFGRRLIQALNGLKAEFAVLAITESDNTFEFDDMNGVIKSCRKTAPPGELQQQIRAMYQRDLACPG